MIITLIFILLVAAAWLLLAYKPRQRTLYCDSAPVRSARVGSVLIVCLDCDRERTRQRESAGLDPTRVPHKTFLTSEERCDACGSRAYVLASTWGLLWTARIKSEFAVEQGMDQVYSDAPREWKEEGRA